MKSKLTISETYPWHRILPGECFFVPALDLREAEREGLREAMRVLGSLSRIRATHGVYNGFLGVMFSYRVRQSALS